MALYGKSEAHPPPQQHRWWSWSADEKEVMEVEEAAPPAGIPAVEAMPSEVHGSSIRASSSSSRGVRGAGAPAAATGRGAAASNLAFVPNVSVTSVLSAGAAEAAVAAGEASRACAAATPSPPPPLSSSLTVLPAPSTPRAPSRRRSARTESGGRERALTSAVHSLSLVGAPAALERLSLRAPLGGSRTPAGAPATQPVPQFLGDHFHSDPASGGARKGKVLLWFRSDLRLHDHPALDAALSEAGSVLPLYCFDPRQFGKTSFGFEKTGRYRAKFLIESVSDMRRSLKRKGSDMVVRQGRPEEVIPELCRRLGIKHVMFHREVTYEEQECEEALCEALKELGIEAHAYWSNTLHQADDLPFAIEDMPDVYTEFRESVEARSRIRAPLAEPERMPLLPRCDAGRVPTLQELGLGEVARSAHDAPQHAATSIHTFTGGESEALRRLEQYVTESKRAAAVGGEAERTSAHLGADFSCKISPWLALGCVSPRRIFAEIKCNALGGVEVMRSTTYFELVWRDFFRFITQKYGAARLAKKAKSARRSGRGGESHGKVNALQSAAVSSQAMAGVM